MKKVAIMQPYFFPYIGYFQTLKAVDDYVIYDDVQFIKGGWINRNNILVGGQQKHLFSISLADASPNKLINEIEIKDDFQKFLKTVAMAYAKAPYVAPVLALLNRVCSFPDKNLARFNGNSLIDVAGYLGLDTHLLYSSDIKKDNQLKAQDKVIAICQELGAEMYINAIGGQELYDKAAFADHNIELKFIKSKLVEYKQFKSEFVPWLSLIDVLMFNSPEQVNEMLDSYELI